MDVIKTIIATFIGAILSYLKPVHNAMYLLLFIALWDILIGMLSGIIVSGEKFRFRKFILAALYALIYLAIVAFIYTIGEYQGDARESLYVVKTTTYVFIYFYSTNIIRNLRQLFPANRVIRFLDFCLGLEFTKRISALDSFIRKEKEESKD